MRRNIVLFSLYPTCCALAPEDGNETALEGVHIFYSPCLNTTTNSKVSLFRSMGSVEADLEILAVINSNTTRKAEALNHLVEGLDSGILEGLNVSAIRVLGKQFKR